MKTHWKYKTDQELPELMCVYSLIDPRFGSVFYIGSTKNLKKRYYRHLIVANSNTPEKSRLDVYSVVRAILSVGLYPKIKIIETADNSALLKERETFWIEQHIKIGSKLENNTTNKRWLKTRVISEETKKRISISNPKRVPIICNETGIKYGCIGDAAKAISGNPAHIASHLRGDKNRKTIKGFTFRKENLL